MSNDNLSDEFDFDDNENAEWQAYEKEQERRLEECREILYAYIMTNLLKSLTCQMKGIEFQRQMWQTIAEEVKAHPLSDEMTIDDIRRKRVENTSRIHALLKKLQAPSNL